MSNSDKTGSAAQLAIIEEAQRRMLDHNTPLETAKNIAAFGIMEMVKLGACDEVHALAGKAVTGGVQVHGCGGRGQ